MTLDLVFWPSMVRTHPFEDHVRTAAAGGFTSLAILPQTYAETVARGLSAADMRAMAADAGVPLRHLDSVTAWAPIRYPEDATPALKYRFDWSADDMLRMAEALGLTTMTAAAIFEPGRVNEDALIEGFAAFCKRAEGIGVRVDLEFLAFFAITDPLTAWRIVEASGAPNAAVMVDTWHTTKMHTDLAMLDQIPADRIAHVQIADGWRAMQGPSMLYDAAHHREFAGDGDLPWRAVLRVLAGRGGTVSIGPEVFSDKVDAMPLDEIARRAGETTRMALADTGFVA